MPGSKPFPLTVSDDNMVDSLSLPIVCFGGPAPCCFAKYKYKYQVQVLRLL